MTQDTSWINTILLIVIGSAGSVLIWKYISPIISTQEKHRQRQQEQITELQTRVDAAQRERELLKEMVTQRAQVDDLRQFVKVAVDEGQSAQRTLLKEVERHGRENAEQHQASILALQELVHTIRSLTVRVDGMRGAKGERGEKGDHGQDASR